MKKVLLFIFLFIPSILLASSINFDDVKEESNNYILNYKNNNKFILDTNIFGFNESGFYIDEDFSRSGLLNISEYNVIGGKNSYLYDGLNYFTMSYNVDKTNVYEIAINDNGYKYINLTESSGSRYTNYAKPRVKVSGEGTYNNPWMFVLNDYNVSYNLNYDNKGIIKTDEVYSGDDYILVDAPSRENYVFVGWNLISDGSGDSFEPGEKYDVKTDTTFYAVWSKKHLVKYDLNGGSGTINSYEVADKSNHIIDSVIPTKEGYTFLGWSLDKSSNIGDYESGDSYTVSSDVTFYAIWQKKYFVIYDPNGGTGGPETDFISANDSYIVKSEVPNANDITYGFKNWNTMSDGSGESYAPGSVLPVNNDITLYAQYDPYIARIGSVYYFKLDDAVNAVNNNNVAETIIMVRNTSENVSISNSKDIILDLNNLTITGKITNNGTLRISSAGIMQNSDAEVIVNNGTLNISNGTFKNSTTTTSDIIINNAIMNFSGGIINTSSETAAIKNLSKLTVTGGTISNTYTTISGDAAAIENVYGGTLEITGGTISSGTSIGIMNFGTLNGRTGSNVNSTSCTISTEATGITNIYDGIYQGGSTTDGNWPVLDVTEGGQLNIFGGTIEDTNTASGNYGTALQNYGTCNITGGTILNNTGGSNGGGLIHNYSDLNISGSAVLKTKNALIGSYGNITISGGTFSSEGTNLCLIQSFGTVNILSGTNISHSANIIQNRSGGYFYMKGGTLTGTGSSYNTVRLYSGSYFYMTDGTITHTKSATAAYRESGASVSFTGGTIKSKNW